MKITSPTRTTTRRTRRTLYFSLFFLALVLIIELVQTPGKIIAKSSSSVRFKHFTKPLQQEKCLNETKFVFFVGLEGTGHHLIRDIAFKSPTTKQLIALGLDETHYKLAKTNKQLMLKMPAPGTSNDTICNSMSNETTYQLFVDLLTTIASKTSTPSITIPVNCRGRGTFASYPFNIKRRPCFDIPNIDLFYRACNQVGVACEHIYLYRDLYSVIASTTVKRKFNRSVRFSILLYTSILEYLYTAFSNPLSKLTACWGVLDPGATNDTVWHPLADMYGWHNRHAEFDIFLNKLYQPPMEMSLQDRKRLIPAELEDEMEAFVRAQEKVLSLCPSESDGMKDA